MIKTDICVIGAGSGGLSVAAGASQMGARVVLIEKGKMGGDCLNYGCVPSKSLIAAGKMAHLHEVAPKFGILPNGAAKVDFKKVHDHVHDVIGQIAPHDSVERFEGLGVHVIQQAGKFTGKRTVRAGDQEIQAKKIVIATGSTAFVPPIKGLDQTPYLTNETIFDLKECPEHLVIVGGGPIGIELSQAMNRLGAKVTVLTQGSIMPKDDPELVDVVRKMVVFEGVDLIENAAVESVAKTASGIEVTAKLNHQTKTVKGSHLLIATGRKAVLDGLDLEKAGIEYTPRGIIVNDRLQTSNKHVYGIGDCIGHYQFTHVASYHAGIVIRNIIFKLPAKIDMHATPWVTYTDPELANVGLTEAEAREKHGDGVSVVHWHFKENDRAMAERRTEGLLKVVVAKNREILGAGIVGLNAGELLLPWVQMMQNRSKINAMTALIAPYPTLSEVSKRGAGSYFTSALFSEKTKKLVRFLMKMTP